MSNLNSIERRHLENLLGMGGGYVLDFSNRTFDEFVFESTKRRIYEAEFANGTGSKAHRLRAFWLSQPDVLTGKLILDLCNYYREFQFDKKNEELYERCLRIGNRLLGQTATTSQIKPDYVAAQTSASNANPKENAATFKALLKKYENMAVSSDHHRRGYDLQEILNDAFRASDIPTTRSFTRNNGGEQIDGAFKFDSWHYLVECRWRERLPDIRQLDGLSGQVSRAGRQTMGLFLSIEGWSINVPPLLKQNPDKGIILMDGFDLHCILSQQIELKSVLLHKLTALNLEAEPFLSCNNILQSQRGKS
jgi:hypothetical protein